MNWIETEKQLPEIDPDDIWHSQSKRVVTFSEFGIGFGYYHKKINC
jgi:hypothetical protein